MIKWNINIDYINIIQRGRTYHSYIPRFRVLHFLFHTPKRNVRHRSKRSARGGDKKRESEMDSLYKRLAAAYFSTNQCSIIGDAGLNFSVRNGKR